MMTISQRLLLGAAALFVAGLIVITAMRPARAYSMAECQVGIGVAVCQPRPAPDARIITMEPVRHEEVTDEDRATWAKECDPKRKWGGTNVIWVYRKAGCEWGPQHLDD